MSDRKPPEQQDQRTAAGDSISLQPGQSVHVPVAREQVKVEKRVREKGQVVVHVEPHVQRQVVKVPLVDQEVHVERVPMNRPVDAPSPPRDEGETTIVPVYEEVYVIEKRLMLKEEIRITRRRHQRHEKQEVDLRVEEAHVLRAENDANRS